MANDSISCKKLLRSVSILPVCAIKVSLRVLDLREPHEYEVGLSSSSSLDAEDLSSLLTPS